MARGKSMEEVSGRGSMGRSKNSNRARKRKDREKTKSRVMDVRKGRIWNVAEGWQHREKSLPATCCRSVP